MARQHELERRDAGWRDLVWAGAAAIAVTLLLLVAVGLVWMLGRSPSEAPVLAVQGSSTPTPRALSFVELTPTPEPVDATEAPTATAVVLDESEESGAVTVVATPELLVMSNEAEPAPAADEGNDVIFEAPGAATFADLASGSWSASGDSLVNPGSNAIAEPWLTLTTAPSPSFALEAEIRVNGLLDSVCDQSFGLAGGSPSTGQMFGGGLLFPCDSDTARARLTDVSVWEDGYNADPVVAEETFDPGDDWHTYRFELQGDRLQLLVDGADVVSGTPDSAVDPTATDAQAGIWAQGVELEVRKVTVFPLPSD
jgi:hypothetical protein